MNGAIECGHDGPVDLRLHEATGIVELHGRAVAAIDDDAARRAQFWLKRILGQHRAKRLKRHAISRNIRQCHRLKTSTLSVVRPNQSIQRAAFRQRRNAVVSEHILASGTKNHSG